VFAFEKTWRAEQDQTRSNYSVVVLSFHFRITSSSSWRDAVAEADAEMIRTSDVEELTKQVADQLALEAPSHHFNRPSRGKEHYDKALQLSQRTTERERLQIQASYEHSLGHLDEAEESIRTPFLISGGLQRYQGWKNGRMPALSNHVDIAPTTRLDRRDRTFAPPNR
jgi:hypothetical protein